MQDIKNFLKKIGMTQSELASELGISRPTLDVYIEQYETIGKLDKERYNIAFGRLFGDTTQSRSDFDKKLKSIEYLFDRDRRLKTEELSTHAADCIADIHMAMLKDMEIADADEKVYAFIMLLIHSYRKNTQLRELARYIEDFSKGAEGYYSDMDKRYFAYYNKARLKMQKGDPPFDSEAFVDYLKCKEEKRLLKKRLREKTRQKVRSIMDDLIAKTQDEIENDGDEMTEEAVLNRVINSTLKSDRISCK